MRINIPTGGSGPGGFSKSPEMIIQTLAQEESLARGHAGTRGLENAQACGSGAGLCCGSGAGKAGALTQAWAEALI